MRGVDWRQKMKDAVEFFHDTSAMDVGQLGRRAKSAACSLQCALCTLQFAILLLLWVSVQFASTAKVEYASRCEYVIPYKLRSIYYKALLARLPPISSSSTIIASIPLLCNVLFFCKQCLRFGWFCICIFLTVACVVYL